jgi:hypothetical protein
LDAVLRKDSAAAAIYEMWRATVDPKALEFFRATAEKRLLANTALLKGTTQSRAAAKASVDFPVFVPCANDTRATDR